MFSSIRIQSMALLRVALACGAGSLSFSCGAPDETSEEQSDLAYETLDQPLNGTISSFSGCNNTQQQKIKTAATIARAQLLDYSLELCMIEHQISATYSSPEKIVDLASENMPTKVVCTELDTAASAPVDSVFEYVRFDNDFLNTSDEARIAAVLLHEVVHNKGFPHGDDASGSDEYKFFPSEVIERCSKAISANSRLNNYIYGTTDVPHGVAEWQGYARGELPWATWLAGAGGHGGSPFSTGCLDRTFAHGLYGRADSRVISVGLSCAPATGNGTSTQTAQHGGSGGGSTFDLSCGANELMIGVEGSEANDEISYIGPFCKNVDLIRTGGGVAPKNGSRGHVGSTSNGRYFKRICPEGKAVKRYFGREGNRLDRIQLECQDIDLGRYQSNTSLGRFGTASGKVYRERCPAGSVMSGLVGRSGSRIDRLGGLCQPVVHGGSFIDMAGTPEGIVIPGHGGFEGNAWGVDRCPGGFALVGLEYRAGAKIDRIVGLCTNARDWSSNNASGLVYTAIHGGTGGNSGRKLCAKDFFLAGWDIWEDDDEVAGIDPVCVKADD